MASVNSAMLSVKLTPKKIKNGESMRRLAIYQYYDGRTKSNQEATVTLVGWGKQSEVLDKLQDGDVVAEGRFNLGDVKDSKDKRLELVVSRIHF